MHTEECNYHLYTLFHKILTKGTNDQHVLASAYGVIAYACEMYANQEPTKIAINHKQA